MECRGILPVEKIDNSSNPYITIGFKTQPKETYHKTKVIHKKRNPIFNELFALYYIVYFSFFTINLENPIIQIVMLLYLDYTMKLIYYTKGERSWPYLKFQLVTTKIKS